MRWTVLVKPDAVWGNSLGRIHLFTMHAEALVDVFLSYMRPIGAGILFSRSPSACSQLWLCFHVPYRLPFRFAYVAFLLSLTDFRLVWFRFVPSVHVSVPFHSLCLATCQYFVVDSNSPYTTLDAFGYV
jgi:hypothetical protein